MKQRPPLRLLALFAASATTFAQAQEEVSADPSGTIVTATREPERAFDLPYSASSIDAGQIQRRAYRTTPRILEDTPGVMVQETSHGQGSPYVRGFTGFRNLLMIDGVRLNNSVFRDGPNQYWSTVDPYSIERLELVKGPSSVLYGSDAIGGTVNVITQQPRSYASGPGGSLFTRYSSAENSVVGRLEVDVAPTDAFGILAGATGKDYGDLEGGEDTGTQPGTGYEEWDADLKLERFLPGDRRLVFLYQQVQQNDVPRTHRTNQAVPFAGTSIGSDRRRELDQRRRLAYLQLHGDAYSLGVSWQEQQEVRDRIRSNGNQEFQGFDADTLGAFGLQRRDSSIGRLTFGFDAYHDDVTSFSSRNAIQGPVADDATYDLAGVYLQDELEAGERTTLVLGARYNYAAADADRVQDPTGPGAIQIEDEWKRLVGSARLLYDHSDEVNLFAGLSQGFRAPNLSDLTRLDSARSNEFEIASPGLEPEDFLSYEVGAKLDDGTTSGEVAVFYTDIDDAIVRFPTGNVNGSGEFEIVKDNVGDGYVFGVEVRGARRLDDDWTVFGDVAYLDGKAETFPTSMPVVEEEYLDRLMPTTVHVGLGWEPAGESHWAEGMLTWVQEADRLSTRDRGDSTRIPPGGTPDHLLVDLRGGLDLGAHVRLDLGLENLLDEDYRVHGSGQNGPGRNLIVSLTLRR